MSITAEGIIGQHPSHKREREGSMPLSRSADSSRSIPASVQNDRHDVVF